MLHIYIYIYIHTYYTYIHIHTHIHPLAVYVLLGVRRAVHHGCAEAGRVPREPRFARNELNRRIVA